MFAARVDELVPGPASRGGLGDHFGHLQDVWVKALNGGFQINLCWTSSRILDLSFGDRTRNHYEMILEWVSRVIVR